MICSDYKELAEINIPTNINTILLGQKYFIFEVNIYKKYNDENNIVLLSYSKTKIYSWKIYIKENLSELFFISKKIRNLGKYVSVGFNQQDWTGNNKFEVKSKNFVIIIDLSIMKSVVSKMSR